MSDRPGVRAPGAWSPLEVAIHAIVAQHCNLARARVHMARLVRRCGQPVPGLAYGLTHLFPAADLLAGEDLAGLGLPRTTAEAIQALAGGMTAGAVVLDSSLSLVDLVTCLTAVPGVEATVAHQIALRLGHRDAFPESDPCIRLALRSLAADSPPEQIAGGWRPWRAVAAMHLITGAAALPEGALSSTVTRRTARRRQGLGR